MQPVYGIGGERNLPEQLGRSGASRSENPPGMVNIPQAVGLIPDCAHRRPAIRPSGPDNAT